ncbi:hypothetical protein [Winogradskyella sp.]|uniref:hypothetical protein n=1 Tax=Winogradskyella sp. TaxID=1883156 RepID=UPI0025E7E145|nr:hypothetical protein [Winogradskyella sp.]MCT4628823.1 hypothetical protein [Winogradskyella sp.]
MIQFHASFLTLLFGTGSATFFFQMKSFRIILSLLIIFSCSNKNYNENEITFSVRKYITSNENTIGVPRNVDLNSIIIDSLVDYPKYLYLETELKSFNESANGYRHWLEISNENRGENLRLLRYCNSQIDTLQKMYSITSKEDKYYKVYTTIRKTIPDTIPFLKEVNEKLIEADSLSWSDNKMFLADEKFNIIDCPVKLNLNLSEELEEE